MRRNKRFRVAGSVLLIAAVAFLARGDKQKQAPAEPSQQAEGFGRSQDSRDSASSQTEQASRNAGPPRNAATAVPRDRAAAQLQLRVVGVHDGDTLTGLSAGNEQVKVRLDAIDAPELGQPFGQAAKKALSGKVFGRQVIVHRKTTDRYGRAIGHVLLDGRDVNLEMLEEGMAWHYKHFDHNARMAAAETAARAAGKGLWAEPQPVAPWEWRQRGKEKPAAPGQ